MASKLRVPRYLQASVDVGEPAMAGWVEALPDLVEDLTARWHLDLGEPFEPGGNCSWVAPATDSGGREVVLKLAWRHTEAVHEAEGLSLLGDQGAVEVYEFEHLAPACDGDGPGHPKDAGGSVGADGPVRGAGGSSAFDCGIGGTTAMLLERCRPGVELRGRPEAEQHRVITDLLQAVWAVDLPVDHPFRPLSVMVDDWVARAEAHVAADPTPAGTASLPGRAKGRARLDAGMAREGLALFRHLSRSGPSDVMLCTDLHAGNVLSGERRPWLLIDPKPFVGDPHYDVLQHLLNCGESLHADPVGLVAEVADLAGLDAGRVRRWLWARCIQECLSDSVLGVDFDLVLRRLGDP